MNRIELGFLQNECLRPQPQNKKNNLIPFKNVKTEAAHKIATQLKHI